MVFSDSHGSSDRIDAVISRQITPADAIFFLGDGLRDLAWLDVSGSQVFKVRGNCDLYGGDAEDEMITELGGVRVFAAHGHRYSVKSGHYAMAARAASLGADIMLFGHTHSPVSEVIKAGETVGGVTLTNPLYVMNPGSIGAYGNPTFGTITVRRGAILLSVAEF